MLLTRGEGTPPTNDQQLRRLQFNDVNNGTIYFPGILFRFPELPPTP